MKDTKIISAFPACGKTYCFKNSEDYIVLDSDSSEFSWKYVDDGNNGWHKERNPDFPDNYICHIKANIGKVDYIFVSSHAEVRKALADAGIEFILVFPHSSLKAEWIGRCFLRGSGEAFCKLVASNWDEWISQMHEDAIVNNRKHYILKPGEYLSGAIKFIN